MAHELFPAKIGLHGPLFGGLIGPSPREPFHHAVSEMPLATAVERGHISLPADLPNGVDFADQGWVNPDMERADQDGLGSCVSFAADHQMRFLSLQAGHSDQKHSPLWLYHEMRQRFLPDQIGEDTGAFGSWAAAIIEGRGFALEGDWPYDPPRFAEQPPPVSYGPALWYRNRVTVSAPLDVPRRKALLAAGHAFMVGFLVYDSFYQAQGNGRVPVPGPAESVLGGHEVLVIGYKDDPSYEGGGYEIWLNQWGSGLNAFSPRNRLQVPYAFVEGSGGDQFVLDGTCLVLAPPP